jgi:Family of unknown function (DUF6491)
MPNNLSQTVIGLGLAIGLVGCAAAVQADQTRPASVPPSRVAPAPSGVSCVWRPEIRDGYYNVVDDSHLVIQSIGKKYYLVTLGRRCIDLDTGVALGLESNADELCTGDSVKTRSDRCVIDSIEAVPGNKEAAALVKARELAHKQAQH